MNPPMEPDTLAKILSAPSKERDRVAGVLEQWALKIRRIDSKQTMKTKLKKHSKPRYNHAAEVANPSKEETVSLRVTLTWMQHHLAKRISSEETRSMSEYVQHLVENDINRWRDRNLCALAGVSSNGHGKPTGPWFERFLKSVSPTDLKKAKAWLALVRKLAEMAPTLTYEAK